MARHENRRPLTFVLRPESRLVYPPAGDHTSTGTCPEIDLDAARYFAEQIHLAAGRKRNLREFVEALVRLETTSRYKDRMGHAETARYICRRDLAVRLSKAHWRYRHHPDLETSPSCFLIISYRN